MTVQDNRNPEGTPAWFVKAMTPGGRSNITQADKDAWIARLESADSNKALGVFHDKKSGAACALGHLSEAVPELVAVPSNLYNEIVRLNDIEQLSLPEIAVWVKENVEVTE